MSNSALTKLNVPSASLCIHIPDNVMCKKKKKKNYKESNGREEEKNTVTQCVTRQEACCLRPGGRAVRYLFVLLSSAEGRTFFTESSQEELWENGERVLASLNHDMCVFDISWREGRTQVLWVDGIYRKSRKRKWESSHTCRQIRCVCWYKNIPKKVSLPKKNV